MSGLFEVIASEQHEERLAARKAVVLSNQRVDDRFGAFLRAAETDIGDYTARLELVRDDIKQVVAVACEETGSDNADAITESILSRLTPQPVATRTASVEHEARKPKLCPYHKEVMDISLAQGEPRAGFDAMAQHAWGAQHCQGSEYEGGKCNFKRDMVTQTYWDNKAEQAEQRRLEREERREQELQEQQQAEEGDQEAAEESVEALEDAESAPDNVVELFPEEPQDAEPTITDELTEAPTAVGIGSEDSLAVAASADEVPLGDKTAFGPGTSPYALPPGDEWCTTCYGSGEIPDPNLPAHMQTPKSGSVCPECGGKGLEPSVHRVAEQKKHLEGDKVTDKRQRQYEHIKEQCLKDGKSADECKELAARTVNKQRSEKGETEKDSSVQKEALTAKDFRLIADAIATSPGADKEVLAQHFVQYLGATNPLFDAQRFIDAAIGQPQTQRDVHRPPVQEPYTENELDRGLDEQHALQDEQLRGASTHEAEALETIDVTKDGEGPVPKIDKRPIDQLPEAPKTEGEGSPVPTRRKDVTEAIEFEESNRENPQETDAVLEKQDVTKDTGPKPVSSSFLPPDELRSVISSFNDE
jgi:hypothetical protein